MFTAKCSRPDGLTGYPCPRRLPPGPLSASSALCQLGGASGLILAIHDAILELTGERGITADGLATLKGHLLEKGDITDIGLKAVDAERAPVFAGGLAITAAVVDALDVDSMTVSDGALREGLLHDLLGRVHATSLALGCPLARDRHGHRPQPVPQARRLSARQHGPVRILAARTAQPVHDRSFAPAQVPHRGTRRIPGPDRLVRAAAPCGGSAPWPRREHVAGVLGRTSRGRGDPDHVSPEMACRAPLDQAPSWNRNPATSRSFR
ncbi:MAG: hypothetical protein F4169_14105 [Gammaproteobacteria bacterium]|nr:hypothetical protein [Gammaproteobacteria bacterium]